MSATIYNQTRQNVNTPNFLTNGDGGQNTTNWTEGSYTAATRPSGTFTASSGASAFTVSSTTTAPLGAGLTSLLFTKTAGASRQGRCAQYECDLALDYKAKVLSINIDYIINSGTFVAGSNTTDSSLIWYAAFYDGSTWTTAEPSSIKCFSNSTTISARFNAQIQTPYNATKMRLIAYVAETATTAWEVKAILTVGPSQYVYGTPITDWQSYTLTIGAVTTPPTQGAGATKSAYWRRVGSDMEIMFVYSQTVAGSAGSGDYLFPLPSGYSIDTTKVSVSTTGAGNGGTVLGTCFASNTASSTAQQGSSGTVVAYNSTNLRMIDSIWYAAISAPIHIAWNYNYYGLSNATAYYAFTARVPITGWSSCVQMSDQTSQQVVDFVGTNASQSVTGNVTDLSFTATKDSVGAWNTNQYVVKVAGDYQVAASYVLTIQSTMQVYKNGSFYAYLSSAAAGSAGSGSVIIPNMIAGDYITLRNTGTTTVTSAMMYVNRISGPASIAATDTVAAFYYASANVTGTSSTPFNFDSKVYDYTGSTVVGSGWKFTAPVAGLYTVTIYTNGSTSPDYIRLYKSGSFYMSLGYGPTNSISTLTGDIKLNAGEYIDFRAANTLTINGGSLAVNTTSWCAIKKIGTF